MKYLLDTNACISVLRSPLTSKVSFRLSKLPLGEAGICSIVRMELMFGAYRSKRGAANVIAVKDLLDAMASIVVNDYVADHAAILRADLAAVGTPIGPYDAVIAACALSRGMTVVTRNVTEFGRIPGLAVENWEI